MEMEVVSRESIKPSSPTPPHLSTYPLSLFDNAAAPNSVPLIYFYAPNPKQSPDEATRISLLKKSLSQVLSIYYPFAGRFKDPLLLHCNDQGASLLVTRIKTTILSDILRNPTESLLTPLFPDELQWKDMGLESSLLAVQINCFSCGGMAITVCMSHKIGDASTLFNFFNDWSTLTREYSYTQQPHITIPLPHVGASSLFPQSHFPLPRQFSFVPHHNMVCRRLVFEGSKIDSLKALCSEKVEKPTRFEVVIALIYKCAVSALGLSVRNTLLRVAINLRNRIVPPLPEKSLGNLASSFYASSMDKNNDDADEVELHEVVTKTREGLSLFCDKYVRNFGDLKFVSDFLRFGRAITTTNNNNNKSCEDEEEKKKDMMFFSGWCRFKAYEADFGWGNPVWVTTGVCPVKNSVVLMDTRDGKGIEAVVCMLDKDMAMFESHLDLLRYASLEPNRWTCSSS